MNESYNYLNKQNKYIGSIKISKIFCSLFDYYLFRAVGLTHSTSVIILTRSLS